MFAMCQGRRLGKLILFLVLLVIVLQVFHMSLLTRLEAQEAMERRKTPSGRHLKERVFSDVMDDIEEKIRNSHRLDYSGTYHVIANLLPADSYNHSEKKDDVTIVTQCSSNHLHHLSHLVQSWDGPISVTVFTFDEDIENALLKILTLHRCNENIRKSVTFHIVYPLNHAPTTLGNSWKSTETCSIVSKSDRKISENYAIEGIEYPHNLLRNLAIKYSSTSFVFMLDIDMIPSPNLHKEFMALWHSSGKLWDNSSTNVHNVFIVPAFELKLGASEPSNKADLLQEWTAGNIRPFYSTVCWKCQKHTDYDQWRDSEQTTSLKVAYQVDWKDPWEPFFIGSKWMPQYDERFKQYGFNRISQVCELHVAGYRFSVLNNAFLLHKGFKEPGKFHSTKEQDMNTNVQLFRKFKVELKVKYRNSTRRC